MQKTKTISSLPFYHYAAAEYSDIKRELGVAQCSETT